MAERKVIMTDKVYVPRVPLSHAVKYGNLVFCSGITPFEKNRDMAMDFAGQMHTVMKGLNIVLEEAGSSLDRVLKVNVILTQISDFAEMNEIYKQYFKAGNYPARTTIEAGLAGKEGMRLEIECVAACDA
jgi:2-iminobutanoate/2-iminopropanoate deaminase